MASTRKSTKGTRAGRSRRGKGEDMTGTKDGAVEQRGVMEELKLAKPDDINHHLQTIKGWKEKLSTLNGHIRNAYKAAKTAKISRKTIDFLLGLQRDDVTEYRREMETIGVGLKAVGAPFQLTVYDTMYGSDIEQSKAEAKIAAKAGRSPECRFPEGTPAYDAYMEEYTRTQARMAPGGDKLTDEEIDQAIAARKSGSDQTEAILQ